VQNAEAENGVEGLPEAIDIERVQPAVDDARVQKLGDRPKNGAPAVSVG